MLNPACHYNLVSQDLLTIRCCTARKYISGHKQASHTHATPTKSKVSNFECQMTDDRCQTSDACNGCQTSDIKHCTSRLPYHLLPTQLTRVEGVWCHKSKSLGWLWKHGVGSIDPNVIDIPTPSELRTKAKLTLLSSISTAQDPLISELTSLLTGVYVIIHGPYLKRTQLLCVIGRHRL